MVVEAGSLSPIGYMPRVGDAAVSAALEAAPIVLIEGVKGCGKTWTGRHHAHSQVLLADSASVRAGAEAVSRHILEGARPRLIDEWQLVPSIWEAARHVVDETRNTGCFILTGSSHPSDDITRHSGAGRVRRVRLRTMSLAESGESTAEVSLAAMLAGEACDAAEPQVAIPEIVEMVCRGGWPRSLGLSVPTASELLESYLDEMARIDLPTASGIRHNPLKINRLLTSIARNTSSTASLSTLARDVAGEPPLSWTATASYLDALGRVFLVEDLPAWSTRLRSRATLQQSPKRNFVDPSLAAAVIGATPRRLLDDFETLGLLFESLVVRDLRVYADACKADVYHFRTSYGDEIDAIVEQRNGTWLAVEVKLNPTRVDEAAQSLLKACATIDSSERDAPVKKIVVTATGYGYERDDGVTVLPITALGP